MKHMLRRLPLASLAAILLTVSALADSGPKPLLTVRVKNAPEEGYYLDLVAEGEYEGHTYGRDENEYSGIDWSYTSEEAAALDPELLDTLRSAVANAENNENVSRKALVVKAALVSPGPIIKRFRAKARGSAGRIRKRTSHLEVILTDMN